jgi:lipopolysaccharide/colanic/teichoic acid biosynthesis glycosyltransferase
MNTRKLEIWILLADLLWIGAAFMGADLLRFGLTWTADERASIMALLPFVIASVVIWTALSTFMALDGFRGGWKLSAVLSHLLLAISCTSAVLLTVGYLTRSYVSRLALGYFILLLVGGFVAVRCTARMLLQWRHRGGDLWRVVILGSGRVAQEVAAKIEQHPEMLCKVVGILFPNQDASEQLRPESSSGSSQVSTLDIFELLREWRVNEIIVALSQEPTSEIRTLISRVRDMGIETTLVPQSYELYTSRPALITLDGLPLVKLREPGLRRRYVVLKRVMDVVLAIALLPPATVVLIPAAAALGLCRRAPFRREKRCGQYGVPFQMLRLNVDRPVHSNSAIERVLDHLSITELPQLWNVLRGQMSLVGPRPDPIVRLREYSEWQQRRLKVKPGMTGLAQVHGLREHSALEQKTRYDLQYLVNPYLLADISLLLQTIWTLARRVTARPKRGAYELKWQDQAREDVISNAHRTQSSTD